MNDPYKVLGVSRNASEEEIKAAYKALVKKYHPDQYQGNPLAEFAEEKMAEINSAYDAVIEERRNGGSTYSYGNNGYSSGYNSGSNGYNSGSSDYNGGNAGGSYGGVDYMNIRRMISAGNVTQADQILDTVPVESRNGEWFFLKGNIAYSRGWLEEAYNYFGEACRLEPGNNEYNAAFSRMNQQGGGYMQGENQYTTRNAGNSDACDCISTLCIADCCCECMGGDLVPCF